MPYFTQDDLQYTDYVWHSRENHDDPTKTHFPDNKLLATHEGYEMLTFINALARQSKWTNKNSGHKTERLLKRDLPQEIRGRIDVRKWLVDNWQRYQ